MRIHIISILCLAMLLPIKGMTLEPVNEAHAMFYYQVPFSAGKTEQEKHSFGFRMDHASYEHGEMIQYQQLMNKTAAFDFKMARDGVQGMYISGVDYLQLYRLHRAAEDTEEEDGVDAGTKEKKSSNPVTTVAGNIGETIDEVMEIIPLGFLVGGVVGIVLVTGAAD